MPEAAGPFLVCGLGNVGLRVVELLCAAGLPAVVLTREATAERTRLAGAAGARVVFGDARDDAALLGAGLASARALLLLTSHDVTNVAIALDAQRLAPEVPIVVRLFDATFGSAGSFTGTLATSDNSATLLKSLVVLTGGEIVAGGDVTDGVAGTLRMAAVRITPTGGLDATFGTGGAAIVTSVSLSSASALVRQSDGKLVLAGFGGDGVTLGPEIGRAHV